MTPGKTCGPQAVAPTVLAVSSSHEATSLNYSVSVIICAHTEERWDDLIAAVASVRAQRLKPVEVIVVVDHNPALYARLVSTLDATVVQNRNMRGLSAARNTGVEISRGSIVVFLDDDAVADPGWLQALVAPYADPNVMGVDGWIIPSWDDARPIWWPKEFDWVVGCTFVGREPGPVRNLLGGSASFRREAFDMTGGFSIQLGRSADKQLPLGCEETEFCIRVSRRRPEAIFLFESHALIRHRVRSARARFSYFRSRCYAEGISKAFVTSRVGIAQGLAAERAYATIALRRGLIRGLCDAFLGDPAGLLRAGAIALGFLVTVHGYLVGTVLSMRRRELVAKTIR